MSTPVFISIYHEKKFRAGLHDNVPADFTAEVAKSPPVSCTSAQNDALTWVATPAVQPTFWDSDSF